MGACIQVAKKEIGAVRGWDPVAVAIIAAKLFDGITESSDGGRYPPTAKEFESDASSFR